MIKSLVNAYPCSRGKVRDTYDIGGGKLVVVTTDRLSAYDVVLPNTIPFRGQVLTKLTKWWADRLTSTKSAVLSDKPTDMPVEFRQKAFEGRVLLVKKCKMFPYECVARGFLSGSALTEYKANGTVANVPLPTGLPESTPLYPPLFTPATKSTEGHDINLSFAQMKERLSLEGGVADQLKKLTLNIFKEAQEIAFSRGLYIADTKFEFGWDGEEIILCDEIITPDSSRLWPIETYRTGPNVPCLDKQKVRRYLRSWVVEGAAKEPPQLPQELIEEVSRSYLHALFLLTGEALK